MNEMNLHYDVRLYPKPVVIKAAYRFVDLAYIHLDISKGKFVISITNKNANTPVTKEMFDEEMLLQSARYCVARQTYELRKMTMARAFASTVIKGTDGEPSETFDNDYDTDTILKDWFEDE